MDDELEAKPSGSTARDEQLARELAAQLEAGDDEERNAAAAMDLSEQLAVDDSVEPSVLVQTKIFCLAELEAPRPSTWCTTETAPQVRVAAAVAADGRLVATETTDLAIVENSRASWQDGEAIQFTLPKASLLTPTTLCFTVFVANQSSYEACCTTWCGVGPSTTPLSSEAHPFAATSQLPLSSRDGSPADWLDDTPRDHYLDDGAVLTLSAAIIPL